MATVYNLFTNPSFISNTTGWVGLALSGTTPTISTDSSSPLFGTGYSAKITFESSSPRSGLISDDNYRIPVIAGQKYTFSAYVKVPIGQATSDFSLRAYFYTSGTAGAGDLSSSDSAPTTISSYDGWVRLTFTFTVPATATHFRGFVYRSLTTTVGSGYNFLVDALQFETGDVANTLKYDQGQKNKLVDKALTNVYIDHLTGMKLKADIRLGDFVFNRIDEYGVIWVVNDVEGWWNLPQVDMQDLPRGWGDGSYTTYGRYGSRQLTLTGSFILQDPDTQLEAARERLIKAINLVKKDSWLVLDEDTPKALKVRLSGTPSIATVNPRGKTDFSIGLVSADPIKYKWADARDDGYALATVNAITQTVPIRNDGNTPVGVVFDIIGPTTGPVSIFNKTSEQLIDVIYRLNKYRSYAVEKAEVENGNLVFTTDSAHGFSVGEAVDILNVPDIFKISSVICSTTDYLDITTEVKHNFSAGQKIYLTGISGLTNYGNVANGTYTITNVYGGTDDYKFRVNSASLALSTAVSRTAVASSKFSNWTELSAITYDSANNLATVNTAITHGFSVTDQIVISNTDAIYNGTWTVTGVPSSSSFELSIYGSQTRRKISTYACTLSLGTIVTSGNTDAQIGDFITIEGVNEDFNGTHEVASISGTTITFYKSFPSEISTPASSTYGYAYVSKLSDRASASFTSGKAYYGNIYNGYYNVDYVSTAEPTKFKAVRPIYYANVVDTTLSDFGGASTSPRSRIYAEALSIDTYTRDVALNGELGGYRSKLDTVVDWIELQPGDNEIVFEDFNKIYVSQVTYAYTNVPNTTATITTETDHNLVVGSQVKVVSLNTVAGGSAVFANNSTATVLTVPDTKTFTYTPTSLGSGSINTTSVSTGYIYEISPATLNIYYRSGWIG
jgi:hypothetical protein